MNKKGILGAVLLCATLFACTDESNYGPGRQPGYLYFHPTEAQSWGDGNKTTRAGVEAPMLMECSLDGQPIYLHTEVNPTMSPQLEESMNSVTDSIATTRGVRYTGDVFTPSTTGNPTLPKITNFGIYATKTNDRANPLFNFVEISPSSTETYSGTNWNYLWNVREQEVSGVWDSGTADFYGYAPYIASTNDNGLSLSASSSTGVPTLSYSVPSNVQNQLDILTAKHLNVAKGSDVELEFTHVMSAIKFIFAYGHEAYTGSDPDGTIKGAVKSTFTWSDGVATYDLTVTNIQIKNVYTTGTWEVGGDPYAANNPARWTRTADTKATFSYAPAKNLANESSSPVEVNPDYEPNVFMMLPQEVPSDAEIELTCSLTPSGGSTATKTMTLKVPLKDTDGTTPKTWLPGYTYTYTISLSDFAYIFDYNTAETKTYPTTGENFHYTNSDATQYQWNGFYEENVFIRSYKVDSKGVKTPVQWDIMHSEIEPVQAEGANSTDPDYDPWKTGPSDWIHVYDKSTGSYETKVITTHNGAREEDAETVRLFKIEVASIMTPVIDLSLWNYDQTKKWKGRSTANCYIVAGPGTYRIPLIYGNAWSNGSKNELAYKTSKTDAQRGNFMLKTNFLNCNGVPLQSPFINVDLADQVDHAVLIWEEGVDENGSVTQALRESYGGGASGTPSDPDDAAYYHDLCNMGTVVKVKWDIDNAITYEDDYNQDKGDFKVKANYLQFKIDPAHFNYGNAVVGICDNSGKILWSWHIWITDPTTFTNGYNMNVDNHNVTFASTNIGWVDAEASKKAAATREGHVKLVQKESGKEIYINATQKKSVDYQPYFTNVLYQFGRKDPMRGIVDFNDDDKNYGAPRGSAGVTTWTNNYQSIDYTPNDGPGIVEIQTLIKNPNAIYGMSEGDLYPSSAIAADNKSYCNLWGTNISESYQSTWGTWKFEGKTIYDPSPVGYCVPPARYLMTFARSSLLIQSRNWARGFVDVDPRDADFPIKAHYNLSGVGEMYFCASGLRSTTAGDGLMARGYERSPDALACYHTSTPYSRDENYQLHLYFYPAVDTHTKILGDHCEALSVLPVVWTGNASGSDVEPEEQYLTFTFPSAGALYWMKDDLYSTDRKIEYSLDNGTTWTEITPESTHLSNGTNKITITNAGGTVLVRNTTSSPNTTYCRQTTSSGRDYCYFYSADIHEVSGNVMSLFYATDFADKTAFPSGSTYSLSHLFYNDTNLEDVGELVLPATTLTTNCYESMFQGCTNLYATPALPATSPVSNCYENMFRGCTNLKSVNVMLNPNNSTAYTENWLNGVASTGTFTYKSGVSWPSGASGIPSGWTAVPVE